MKSTAAAASAARLARTTHQADTARGLVAATASLAARSIVGDVHR